MYFVDRSKIEETLQHLDFLIGVYERQSFEGETGALALERLAQMSIESVIDVGNMMIDGFIMRDPGSYNDIIDILMDEKVIPKEDEDCYKTLIALRKPLIQDYVNIEPETIHQTLEKSKAAIGHYSEHVRYYLNNELGPVSAFSNS
ncbi:MULTISPECIES: DUF86 domain-containing protein [Pontibacillus]|uniref:DUF86 domain-containing protein n=1 Tax=Pontibacillus chungwhensis TaxID=265426 RepID=A0ABY8UY24_9BACI|nr:MULTISPECIES: DUF86 domain-containing protein [Pontibacillus]MCD5325161.1 DUF86 domain-containing protein [Pontibacillus sp. HN14]WIF97409.1 DUF86 domain-containing protein [Pontibacillus chungwhensis]